MLQAGYQIVSETPSDEDYRRLHRISGLSEKSEAATAAGLPNTWFAVQVETDLGVVGMGRIIGDGGTAFQIVDIAVDPAHQGKGIGKAVMEALVDHLKSHAPRTAYVSLIADGDAKHLYAKYGFEPVAPASIGMALRIL